MKWTEEEIAILRDTNKTHGQLKSLLTNRTISSIYVKCFSLGIRRSYAGGGKGSVLSDAKIEELRNGEFLEIVNGHLLGDGCIGGRHQRFQLSNTHFDYVEYTQEFLNKLTERKVNVGGGKTRTSFWAEGRTSTSTSYDARCSLGNFFKPLRKKWYLEVSNGKYQKIIPRDLELTPLTCNRLYIDDGSLRSDLKSHSLAICIYTDDFLEDDVDFLIEKFNEQGIGATKESAGIKRKRDDGSRYRIKMHGPVVIEFLNYIGECPVESYKYKWDIKTYQNRTVLCSQCSNIIEEWGFGPKSRRKTCSKKCRLLNRAELLRNRRKAAKELASLSANI